MKNTFISTLGAMVALAFVSVMATAAPPDAFHAELIYLDAPPGYTVAPQIADEVSFEALGDAAAQSLALAADEYQIDRMPLSTVTLGDEGSHTVSFAVHDLGVGVFVDIGTGSAGAMVKA